MQKECTLYLSGTPSRTTGTRPPSCLHLDNRLYIQMREREKNKLDREEGIESNSYCGIST